MPVTVKFRDGDKDILDAVRCGPYEDANNSDSDGDESDKDEDTFENCDSMTMPHHRES